MGKSRLTFSQREGYKNIPGPLKLGEICEEIRNELELCLVKALELYRSKLLLPSSMQTDVADWEEVMRDIWVQFYGLSLQLFRGMNQVQEFLVGVIHNSHFNDVFDLIEELISRTASKQLKFAKDIMEVFERKRAAYRVVGSDSLGFTIIPVTNEGEVNTVKDAFNLLSIKSPMFDVPVEHLMRSGKLLREGKYGKSIAESSLAIEATMRILTGSDKEHNQVLSKFLKLVNIHPALKDRIAVPYIFGSDISDGRHSGKQAGYEADRFDAQYIFSNSCSTIQYLINKRGELKGD